MPKFRTRPIIVEARQVTDSNEEEIRQWAGGDIGDLKEGLWVVKPQNNGTLIYANESFQKEFIAITEERYLKTPEVKERAQRAIKRQG